MITFWAMAKGLSLTGYIFTVLIAPLFSLRFLPCCLCSETDSMPIDYITDEITAHRFFYGKINCISRVQKQVVTRRSDSFTKKGRISVSVVKCTQLDKRNSRKVESSKIFAIVVLNAPMLVEDKRK
ncbi:hypothetical protein BBH88_12970 [Planococcus antarcticus DSM 14505]|uniref:Secreted protein n=1 Tax=Planococcus antarcticus DSM 14505 TaxID=1185653 RepID=A0ABN4RGJ4_9BACL|nr:hypothetical protein BBH88_12970 [Planococcus antarcticus DSM 14505]